MILVDVQVPMLERIYDFELEEELQAGVLLEEIMELIAGKENMSLKGGSDMLLYAAAQERILKRDKSLEEQGVRDGDRLILI